jgi:rhodanese-related sulfurtransferase
MTKLLFTFLLGLAWGVCAAPLELPEVELPPQAREVSLDDVQKLIGENQNVGILDVRTIEEVTELGRVPGAKHLDYFSQHFLEDLAKQGLDPSKPCVVYCALGGRSKRAASLLAKAGFKDIVIPAGGFNAWKKAGKPIEGGKPAK